MQDAYYEVSTLYVLGCVLAYQRIFLLDGVYVQLENDPARTLKNHQKKIESEIVRLAEKKIVGSEPIYRLTEVGERTAVACLGGCPDSTEQTGAGEIEVAFGEYGEAYFYWTLPHQTVEPEEGHE